MFSPGERVEHHGPGPGLVLAAGGGRLTVLFDEYGYCELVAGLTRAATCRSRPGRLTS
jgi:hypothetical protein